MGARTYARLTLFALLFCGAVHALHSQTIDVLPTASTPYVEIGLDPAVVITLPFGDATTIRGSIPCSQDYGGVSTVNLGLLGWLTYVFSPEAKEVSFLHLRGLRFTAGYDDITSDFESPAVTYESLDTVNGRFASTQTQFFAEFQLKYLRAAAELELVVGENLFFRVGPSISIPLSGSSTEREDLLRPSNATFENGRQERTIEQGTGELSDLGMRLGLAGVISYRLPLGRRVFFEPSFGVDFGFTKVQPEWTPFIMRAGINFGYAFLPSPPPPPPPPSVVERQPDPPRERLFSGELDVRVASERLPIELRRQVVARYVPMIPVVFFDQNASEIPNRYRTVGAGESGSFSENSISSSADDAHHQVLNLIGARLKANPRVRVTLTGTTSEDEESRPALSKARAERIANYLNGVWGIERSRITVKSRLAPAVPSNSLYPEGREENRRVEIELGDDNLYRPVQLRTVEPVTEPRQIEFGTSARTLLPVDRWQIVLSESGSALDTLAGVGAPPERVSWSLTQEDRERLLSGGRGTYQLVVFDTAGRALQSSRNNLPLRLDTTVSVRTSVNQPDNTAEFLLITFDFDRADLTGRGREELKAILNRIGPNSVVSIVGYTDRLGEETHNKELAAERARRVASAMPAGARVSSRGAGPEEAPYGNDSPEGRFLSRTVRVTIVNPK